MEYVQNAQSNSLHIISSTNFFIIIILYSVRHRLFKFRQDYLIVFTCRYRIFHLRTAGWHTAQRASKGKRSLTTSQEVLCEGLYQGSCRLTVISNLALIVTYLCYLSRNIRCIMKAAWIIFAPAKVNL